MDNGWEQLFQIDHEISLLKHTQSLLGWDQETYMPKKGIGERAEQISFLESLIHERLTSPSTQEAFAKACEENLAEPGQMSQDEQDHRSLSDRVKQKIASFSKNPLFQQAYLREWKRKIDRAIRIPPSLVAQFAYAASLGQAKWAEAKEQSSFSLFQPYLERLVNLAREVADALGYEESPYDAFLEEYEPGMSSRRINSLFTQLKESLIPLVTELGELSKKIDASILRIPIPIKAQEELGIQILKAMNFPFDRSRLDVSVHPFTSTLGRDDVRITTRYNPSFFPTALFGIIHEAGHALYELGFDTTLQDTLLADGVSLGIHESQSRFWENCIGRSKAFWTYWYPILVKQYAFGLQEVPFQTFIQALNIVQPSLIRVEADEVTYPLHIILRFQLELPLMENQLTVSDLPDAFRQGMRHLLGVIPKNDAEGVLQDIHWSMGSFGYFPTYALGTLYAAQFYAVLKKQFPALDSELSQGKLETPLQWLRSKVHAYGKIFAAEELCKRATGSSLDPSFFIQYLKEKYRSLWQS
ncbi:MAG: carboxypeptidase M32 [Spirochaetales bacterium]